MEETQPNSGATPHWGLWGTVFFGLLLLGVSVILPGLIIGIYAGYTGKVTSHAGAARLLRELQSNGFLLSRGTVISSLVCSSILAAVIKLKRGSSIREYLGLAGFNAHQALRWGGLLLALIMVTDISSLLLGFPIVPEFNLAMYKSAQNPLLFWAAVLIFAPLWEEGFFRGFLLTGFSSSFLRPVGAVLITAVVWAGMHIQYQLHDIIPVFLFGCLLGAARVKTGSVALTMAMHSFANLVSFIETIIYLKWVTS